MNFLNSNGLQTCLRLITFDATGTLLRFRKPPVEFYMEFGRKHGIETNEAAMKSAFREQWKLLSKDHHHFGLDWKCWWTQFVVGTFKGSGVKNVPDSTLNLVASELISYFGTSNCWDVKPGCLELLQELSAYQKQNKIQIGVISNFDPRLREILRSVGISKYFDFLVLSHENQISKPSKEIFDLALKKCNERSGGGVQGVTPNEALHIGDNYQLDFLGARNAGWNSLLLISNQDKRKDDSLKDLPQNCTLESLNCFKRFLIAS